MFTRGILAAFSLPPFKLEDKLAKSKAPFGNSKVVALGYPKFLAIIEFDQDYRATKSRGKFS